MAIYSNNVNLLNSGKIYPYGKELGYFKRMYLGSRSDYYKAVVPLVNLNNSSVSRFSYTAGRIDMIRSNGCCYQGGGYMDFEMQKVYNSTNYHWKNIHVNGSYCNPCKFTYQGNLWAGMHIFLSVQAHAIYFSGFSAEALNLGYIAYQDTRDSSILNSEVYNSLVIGTA